MPRGHRRRGGKAGNALFRSAEWIGWALGGLEREIAETRERLASLTAQAATLRNRIGGSRRGATADAGAKGPARRRRGRMTPEGRKRISEMMKKRWAEAKKKNRNRL